MMRLVNIRRVPAPIEFVGPDHDTIRRRRAVHNPRVRRDGVSSREMGRGGVRREQVKVSVSIKLYPGVPVEVPEEWRDCPDFHRLVTRLGWVRAEDVPEPAPPDGPLVKKPRRNKKVGV
jgi:hypothetical protein